MNDKKSAGASSLKRLTNNSIFALFIIYLVLVIYLSFASKYFFTWNNFSNIGISISVLGIAGMGATMVMFSSGLDLSIGASMAISCVVISKISSLEILPWYLILLIALLVTTCVGLVNGILITVFSIHPTIVTLGISNVVRGIAYVISQGMVISTKSPQIKFFGTGKLFGVIPVPMLLLIIAIVLAYLLLKYTTFGRAVYAIGGSERAAHLAGIDVKKMRLVIFTLTGFLAGISGIILTGLMGSGQASAATGYEMDIITAVLLGGASLGGGKGSVLGTALGLLFIGTLNNGMTLLNVDSYWQIVAKGMVLLIAVIFDSIRKKRAAR